MPKWKSNHSRSRYRGKRRIVWAKWVIALGAVGLVADLLTYRLSQTGGTKFLSAFLIGFSALVMLYGALWLAESTRMPGGRIWTTTRRVMEAGFGLWLLTFVILECVIASGSKSDAPPNAQYLVVLGAGLNGETPSLVYQSRLDTALGYLRENPDTMVVVTGGQGPNETITEAVAGARFLEAGGISRERILLEDTSTSTSENVRFALEHVPEGSVTVMTTNEFHIYRSRRIARLRGLDAYGLAAPTPGRFLKSVYYFREYFSVVFMFFGRT